MSRPMKASICSIPITGLTRVFSMRNRHRGYVCSRFEIRQRGAAELLRSFFQPRMKATGLQSTGQWEGLETQEYHAPARVPFEVPEQTIDYYPLFEIERNDSRRQAARRAWRRRPAAFGGAVWRRRPFEELRHSGRCRSRRYSIAAGEALWRSIKEKKPIGISELLHTRQYT